MGRKGATGARLERLGTSAKRLAGEFIGRHFTGKFIVELTPPAKMAYFSITCLILAMDVA